MQRKLTSLSRGLAALAAALTSLAVVVPAAGAKPAPVASFPVSFQVINENRSSVQCPADNGHYTVVGHITGPQRALSAHSISAGALYLHGDGVDESFWRFTGVPGYDYAAELAQHGFVSVTVDRLGYGASGRPNGNKVCWGSEADVAHQIVQELKAGTYSASAGSGTRSAPKFTRLALVGHSAAGYISMAEAYSFHDIDALAVVASGESFTPRVVEVLASQQSRCITSSNGYALLDATNADATADFFHDADPAVLSRVVPTRPPDSCGGTFGSPSSLIGDYVRLSSVTVPVLCIAGQNDAFFPDPSKQAVKFTGSKNVSSVSLPDTGHAITLGRTAPMFASAMENWLAKYTLRASVPKAAMHGKRHRKHHHHKHHR